MIFILIYLSLNLINFYSYKGSFFIKQTKKIKFFTNRLTDVYMNFYILIFLIYFLNVLDFISALLIFLFVYFIFNKFFRYFNYYLHIFPRAVLKSQ